MLIIPLKLGDDNTAHVINCMRGRYDSAKNFKEGSDVIRYELLEPKECQFCNAQLFNRESSTICCVNGKISLPNIPIHPELLELFRDQTQEGKHFWQYIWSYNHLFAFTSVGVQVDENLASTSQEIYTFRAQGGIYHTIGSFFTTTK